MPQISSTDLFQQKGDPRGIHLTNHCLKPLWAHRPRDKDSRELYSALAGISGCLCRDWQARLFLRWKIAAGQPTASCLSISQSGKLRRNLWDGHKGMSPLSPVWRTQHSRFEPRPRVRTHNNGPLIVFNVYYNYYFSLLAPRTLKRPLCDKRWAARPREWAAHGCTESTISHFISIH